MHVSPQQTHGSIAALSARWPTLAMGRQKGTVELVLEPGQVEEVCTHMKQIMPEKISGALQAAPEKIFNEYACKSAQPQNENV